VSNNWPLFFESACFLIGTILGCQFTFYLPWYLRWAAPLLGAVGVYFALMYPFYRGLKLYPMVLPRCPCCGKFQEGFHILGVDWPRVSLRCPTCDGEFVIWHNGKAGDRERWETPVLALKWPYAFGIYSLAKKPEPASERNAGSTDATG
jgi:hypothetical protein